MNNPSCYALLRNSSAFVAVMASLALIIGCSPPTPRATGNARAYEDAKDMFKKGRFDRALDFTGGLANSSPPNEFTERARVLQAVILSGLVNAYQNLTDAYQKGSEKTPNAHLKGEYNRLRHDNLEYWSRTGLGLGEVALQLTRGGAISKELVLEAPYPSTEGPLVITQLNRVIEGASIPPEDEEAAARDAQSKGIDDALAEVVQGDRSKARSELTGGPVKLDSVDFALFLAKHLLDGANAYDRKHMHEPTKFLALYGESQKAVTAALALLKDSPNADKQKAAKKLQDQLKAAMKNM